LLPPKMFRGDLKATSIRLPADLLAELDSIAEESGYTRSEVVHRFLEWGAIEFRKLKARLEPEKKRGGK